MSDLMEMLFEYQPTPFTVDIYHLLISIVYAFLVSTFMIMVYRLIHTDLSYDKRFAITLMMLSLISTILLALVQNNPLLSLGVLGSLSICRIRTNTRDPRDIGFVFWSLAIGISAAVGTFIIGSLGSVFLGLILVITFTFKRKDNILLLIIRGDKKELTNVLKAMHVPYPTTIQSKNISSDSFELVYELKMPQNYEESLLTKISNLDGVSSVNILAPESQVQ